MNKKIKNANELVRLVRATPVGRKVSLTYVRRGKEHTTKVVITEGPKQL